ncbi:hypothetical protein ACPV36_19520 [Photobacterium damselae]|uniref:hypothetical protein n=1 Tax=Photobacterium damselae TaxID=38293 RepID=UPI004067E7EB
MSGYSGFGGRGAHIFNNLFNITVNGCRYYSTDEYNGWLITADDIKSSDGKTITQLIESVSNSNTTTNQTVSDLQNGLSGVNTNLSKIGTAIGKIRTRLTAVEQLASMANSTANTAKNHAQLAYEKSKQALDAVANVGKVQYLDGAKKNVVVNATKGVVTFKCVAQGDDDINSGRIGKTLDATMILLGSDDVRRFGMWFQQQNRMQFLEFVVSTSVSNGQTTFSVELQYYNHNSNGEPQMGSSTSTACHFDDFIAVSL